jgi:hypothetical protein
MIEQPPVDFLNGRPAGPIQGQTTADNLLQLQYDVLKRIRTELRKRNADVLTSVLVGGTSANVIADQNAHQVFFQIANKTVEIYKLVAVASVFTTWCLNLVNPPAHGQDGIILVPNVPVIFDTLALQTVYVRAGAAPPVGAVVNGPATITTGGLFLWGWTVPDPDAPDWE